MNFTSPSSGQAQPATAGAQTQTQTQTEARSSEPGVPFSASLQARGGSQGQVTSRSGPGSMRQGAAMLPPVDIFEDEAGVTLLADLPGVAREQLQVRVDGETLLIEGSATVPDAGEFERVQGELLSPHYRRSFTLSRDLDTQRIDAHLRDGVLRLRIHKAEQARPRHIEVQPG